MRLSATLASAAWLLLALSAPADARFALAPVKPQQVSEADLLLLFDRPAEPVFTLRGLNRDVAFDVPVAYLPERYKAQAAVDSISANARRSGVRLIPLPELDMTQAALDFADIAVALPFREGKYSRANPTHLGYAIRFEKFFQAANTNDDMLARGAWARLHYHPEMVLDGWRGALSRRTGAQQGVQMPEQPQYLPEMYVDDKFFAKVREEMFVVPDGQRVVIPVIRNETQKNTGESKTWYWLEDPHLNVFHWHWHINYPPGEDDRQYVDRDRRGELFVYFHRQMIARLNAERFANGVPRLEPLNVREPVKEAFFPKMISVHQGRGYPARQANTSLLAQATSLDNLDLWTSRYRKALKQKYMVTPEGRQVPLSGIKGLDTITNALEPNTVLSPNTDFYGDVHNSLHGIMGLAHDPNHDNYETISTMSVLATVRDTGFYRLHLHMDDLYEEYKVAYLQPYQTTELTWQDVSINSLSVRSDVSRALNELHTFWQETDLDLSMGLAFSEPGRAYGRFRHLQHEPFSYELQVLNKGLKEKRAYVRIFLITLTDEAGQPLDLKYQQHFAIEMDRFEATLEPGLNDILRESAATPLTVDHDAIYSTQTTFWGARRVNQCRCGWPQTLLVPRGNEAGITYKLFAMVTDYDQDKTPASANEICHDGWILCGVPGSDYYPDARAMGFPFDRELRPDVKSLTDFLTDNMAVQDVVVKFDDSRIDAPSDLLPGDVSTSWMP